MPKVFKKVATEMPTKTVSVIGLGSWQEERTPSELFQLATQAVQAGDWQWDDFLVQRRQDHEQMGFELGERVVQAKSYINGMFSTPEVESDGQTAKQWAKENSKDFEAFMADLAHLEGGQDIYSKGAYEVAKQKEHAAREEAIRQTYYENGGLALDFLNNIPGAVGDFAEIVGDLANRAAEPLVRKTFPYGWIIGGTAAAFLILLKMPNLGKS